MLQRCGDPKVTEWKNYGGRGITVCERWRESFEAFLSDMGPRPSTKHSIDRIDNNGPYAPGNCRWATRVEQGANRRNNRNVVYQGETIPLAEWARRTGGNLTTIYQRMRSGLSLQEAVDVPPGQLVSYRRSA